MPHACSVPLTPSRLAPSAQYDRAEVVYLLVITWAGRAWRWSSRPVDVVEADGSVQSYRGGLDRLTVAREVAAMSQTPERRSVALELDWPGVVDLIGKGHALTTAHGELSMLVVGETYDDRYVLVSGPVSQPEYGYEGTPVALSVVDAPYIDRAVWPPSDACVTRERWPTAQDKYIGRWYPWIFGTPGAYQEPDGTDLHVPGSPAYVVETTGSDADTLLIAGHSIRGSGVTIWYDGSTIHLAPGSVYLVETYDGLTVVDLASAYGSGSAQRTAQEYYAIWTDGPGVYDDEVGSHVTGAGQLLRWWLARSTVHADRGRWASASRWLDRFRVAAYIDEPVVPWEWVEDHLLSVLPLSVIAGPDGLRPVIWRWDATSEDAVWEIRAEAGVVLDGRVTYDARPQDLVSSVRVSWALDDQAQDYRRLTVAATERTTDQHHPTELARTSDARAAEDHESAIDCDWAADEGTAYLIAASILAVQGYASRTVTYDCPQDHGWLSPGDVVTVEDSGLGIDAVGMVTSATWRDTGRVSLTITIPGQPLTTHRSTGPDPTPGTYDDPGAT